MFKDITLETDSDLGIASYEMHDELLGYSSSKIVDGTLMYVADGHVEMSVKLSGKTLRLTLERILFFQRGYKIIPFYFFSKQRR